MLKRLRLQLVLMYPLVGFALIILLGGGVALLVRYYLLIEYYPDQELEARLAVEFEHLGLYPPEEMERLEAARQVTCGSGDDCMYLLYLDADGKVLQYDGPPGASQPAPLAVGLAGAQQRGRDLRSGRTAGGEPARFLTYYLPKAGTAAGPQGAVYVQVVRLTGQGLRVNQLAVLLLGLGVNGALVVGLFSWWLAERSLGPAQKAWDQQQHFIANASHELRAPMTLIRASAEFARRPGVSETRRLELLDDILQECDHVGRLVEDLLLLSRLDAGKLVLARTAVPAAELLGETCRQFEPLAAQLQVVLELGTCEGEILGDQTRLRQVLMILVDNALKFTPPGGRIRFSARTAGSRVSLMVEDSGDGIPPEHLAHIFDRFYQAPSPSGGQTAAGSGLGLSIAQSLVQAQGGTLKVTSQVGQGTQAVILLPAA